MKHREHTSSTLTKGTALLTLLGVLLVPFSSTNAYFSDKESSFENLFGASTLGIVLSVNESDANSRTVTVENDGESELVYSVRVEDSSPTSSFCADVQVKYDGGAEQAVLTALGDVLLPVGGSEAHIFEYIFNAEAHPGKTCVLKYYYEARQDGYNHGEAFYDTEIDIVTLSGATPSEPLIQPVVLNEFLPHPDESANGIDLGTDSSDKPKGEWVELYNNTDLPIDLAGWYVTDASGGEGNTVYILSEEADEHLEPETTTIPANGFLVVYMNKPTLNNTGDTIKLYNSSNVLIDSVSYGEDPTACENDPTAGEGNINSTNGSCDDSNVPPNKSFARIPDGTGDWIDPVPTPGAPNELEEEETDAAPLPSADPLESRAAQNEAAAIPPEAPAVVDPLTETPKKEEEQAPTTPEAPQPPVEEKAPEEPVIEKAPPSEPQAPREESEPEVTENAE